MGDTEPPLPSREGERWSRVRKLDCDGTARSRLHGPSFRTSRRLDPESGFDADVLDSGFRLRRTLNDGKEDFVIPAPE